MGSFIVGWILGKRPLYKSFFIYTNGAITLFILALALVEQTNNVFLCCFVIGMAGFCFVSIIPIGFGLVT